MKGELGERKGIGKEGCACWTMWMSVTFCRRFGKINLLGTLYQSAIAEIILLNKQNILQVLKCKTTNLGLCR